MSKRKFLVHRTVAPRLSELLVEVNRLLRTVHPGYKKLCCIDTR